jgi:hypothetical protein
MAVAHSMLVIAYIFSANLIVHCCAACVCDVGVALHRVPDSKLRIHAQTAFVATSTSSAETRGRVGTEFVQKQGDRLVNY